MIEQARSAASGAIATAERARASGVLEGFLECAAASQLICWYCPDCSKPHIWFAGVMLEALGYSAGELGADHATYSSLVYPEDRVLLENARETIFSEGRIGEYEAKYRMRRKDGTYARVRGTMSVVRLPGTGTISAFGVTRIIDGDAEQDYSILKFTQYALHTVLNEIGHPVVLLTENGIVVQANDATARAVGWDAERLAGTQYCPFLHELDGSCVAPGFLSEVVRTSQRQERELQRFDRWWHVHLVPLRSMERVIGRVLLLAQDITDIKAQQAEQLAREKALTRTLVREVHHRIKNHLQGLVGLLRSYSNSQLSTSEVIDEAVAQILSIATVYGLLAKDGQTSIEFGDLVTQIITTLRVGSVIPVLFAFESGPWKPTSLSQEEAVPLAIAIGELLTNAIKHTEKVPDAYVEGRLSHNGDAIELNITNAPARLPQIFRLLGSAGPSSGLDLVLALLPRDRCQLEIFQDGDKVTTRLRLTRAPTQPALLQTQRHNAAARS
jgi:PAS domain S-box-containing protein